MYVPKLAIKKSVFAVAATLGPCLVLPMSALAQTSDTAEVKTERVEITGSSIKRIDAETALPVTILKREDIERIGAVSTEELVKQLTALSSAGSATTAAGATGFGGGNIATVSLRGLGSARTLVLINGRRTSVYGGGSAGVSGSSVDVNSIPISAIERIEVLKDGASAIYGSDAVAGVVNFILRKDFKGVEATATYGQPTAGTRGADKHASLFAGFGDLANDGYNLSLNVNLQQIDPIFGADRRYANRLNVAEQNDKLSSIAFPANIFLYNKKSRVVSSLAPNCGPVSQVSPFRPTICTFDNSQYISIQPKTEKANLMLNGRLTLNANTEGYFESNFNENKITTTTQPVLFSGGTLPAGNPYNAQFKQLVTTQYAAQEAALKAQKKSFFKSPLGAASFLLPPTSPYYPTAFAAANGSAGFPLALFFRDVPNGPRRTLDVADNLRFLTGIRGTIGKWDYDTGILYSQSKVQESLQSGYAQFSKALPILNSGLINPFGPTTDANALAALQGATFTGTTFTTKTSVLSVDAKASREIFMLPAGAANLAVGAELRKEKFAYDPSIAIQTGDISGLGGNSFPVVASRNVASAYAELSLPVVKNLDTDFAVRFDHYQRVGDTVNPKASVRWQPTKSILLRSSVGTGFRAPSLTDLFTSQATSPTSNGTRDPVRCANPATGSASDCSAQFITITGGNPDLQPEKSIAYTFGVLMEPTKDLSLGLDFFAVNLKNAIVTGGLSTNAILQDAASAAKYSSFIQRGAPDGNPSGVGPIISILQTNANLFKTKVTGVDVDMRYIVRPVAAQKVTFRLTGTYLNKYDVQGSDGSYTNALDQANNANGGGVILRWRHVASATWESGPWVASLAQNYQKAYTDTLASNAVAGSPLRRVSQYQTFDTQLTYSGIKSTKLTLGIKNLLNQDPPYTNNASNFLGGYDVTYADVRGRFIYLTATYRFQ